MTQGTEYQQQHRVIAEFMGLKWIGSTHIHDQHTFLGVAEGLSEMVSKYDYSWDWLMPVVEKIESLSYSKKIGKVDIDCYFKVNITATICEITTSNPLIRLGIVNSCSDKLTSTYNSVLEFINWYNLNHHNHE